VFLFDEEDDDQKDQEEETDLVLNTDENEEFLALFDGEETDEDEEDTAVFDFGTEDVLPEWMIEPEAGDSNGESSTDQPEASEDISEQNQGDLEEEEQFDSVPGDKEIPEWLQSLGGQEEGLEDESLEGNESPSPTWLDEEESGTDESRQDLNDSLDTVDDQSTDTDISKTEEEGTAMNVENDDLPEWLKDLNADANKQASTEPEDESVDEPTQSVDLAHEGIDDEAELAPADMPDWMKDLQPDDTVAETSEMSEDSGLISDDEQEAAYAWLEGLAAKQGVDQDELFLSSEQQSESPPEWLHEEKELSAPEQVSAEISSDIDEIEETVISSTQIAGEEEAIDEVPDWLKDLSDKETMVSSEFEIEEISDTKEAEREEKLLEETAEVPDWIQSLEPGEIESQEDVLEASQGEISMQQNRDFDTEVQDEHDLDLIAETPSSEMSQAESIENEEEELPDWLMDVVDDSQESPEDELPDWLIEPELDADKAAQATDFERQVFEAPDFQDALSLEEEPPVDEEDTQPSRLVMESEDGEPPEDIPVPEDVVPLPTEPQEWVSEEIETTQETEQIEPESEEIIPESSMEISAEEEREIAVDDEVIHLHEDIEEIESPTETYAELEAADLSSQEIEEASPEHNLEDADAAFAWLESLAAKQGVEEALLLSPEERREEPPDWVKDAAQSVTDGEPDEAEEFKEPGELIEEGVLPSQISENDLLVQGKDFELEREASPELETEAASDEEIITQAEVEEPEEIPSSIEISEDVEAKSTDEKVVPELPDWLADIETEPASEETQEWELPVESPATEQQPTPLEQYIEQPFDINTAGLADLERLPGIGFVRAQAILAFRRAQGSINSLDDLLSVEGFDPDIIDGISGKVTFAASQVVPDETIRAEEATDAQIKLTEARNALVSDEMAIAVEKYQELIESESLLLDIITDLNEALFRHPDSLDILQSLGDAYLRNGQTKDAIDTFIKAENLFR
jgi:pilus assembly protein FimV